MGNIRRRGGGGVDKHIGRSVVGSGEGGVKVI